MNVQLPAILRSPLPTIFGPEVESPDGAPDEPAREIRFGLIVAAAFFVVFLGWAAFARMDAAANAPGEITVAGHRQTVQHREGGVVSAIYVKEGQHVRAGDVLLDIAGGEVQATERALAAQVIGLQAQRARLQAEQVGAAAITWPEEFASLSGWEKEESERAKAVQQAQFEARAQALSAQKKVLAQRTAELGEQIEGYRRQIESADRQQDLIGEELKGLQSLAARGFAPMNKVRELQRQQAQIGGSRGQYVATIAQSEQQAGETRLQILQADKARKEQIANDLRDAEFQLNDALPKLRAAQEQLARYQVRSPATGSVVGLNVFTVGGVVAPGQKILDVVPDKAPLVIEARVSPTDADDLHAGQTAEIRFPSIHDRSLPTITGKVTKVSADSFADEKTGARYYTAEVTVPVDQISELERKRNQSYVLKPGLPVQVLVPLRKRTALQYLLEPLGDAIWRSFREH